MLFIWDIFSPLTFLKCTLGQSLEIFNSGDSLERSDTSIFRSRTTTLRAARNGRESLSSTVSKCYRNGIAFIFYAIAPENCSFHGLVRRFSLKQMHANSFQYSSLHAMALQSDSTARTERNDYTLDTQ